MSTENREAMETVETTEVEASEGTEVVETAEVSEQIDRVEPAEDPAKKEKGLQKRFNELTTARHRAEAEADRLRGVLESQQQAAQPKADFIPPGFPSRPALDQFDDYDQYNEALVEWGVDKALAVRDYRTEQGKAKAAQQTVMQGHSTRTEVAREKYQDWDEVFDSANVAFNNTTYDAIIESDQSADIAYHLAKNPAESTRLVGLSPVQQIKEIARLEDKFKAVPSQPVKRVSQAPTPINALNGTGEAAINAKEPDAGSQPDAWSAWERARVAKLGRRY